MVVEVVGPEGMAGHLVERRDRGSGVVTAVDELFDPKYCLSNRDLPVVRTGRRRSASRNSTPWTLPVNVHGSVKPTETEVA